MRQDIHITRNSPFCLYVMHINYGQMILTVSVHECLNDCMCTLAFKDVCFWFLGPIKMMLLASVLFPLDSHLYHKVIIHCSFTILHLNRQNNLQSFYKKKKIQNTKLLWLSPAQAGSLFSRERESYSWWPAEKLFTINAKSCFSIHHGWNF